MSPIVFFSPGLKPDTRLTVFDQEFQVHSMILKLHSAFFRKFLDSADKTSIASNGQPFKYDWVTKVDAKEEWHLVCRGAKAQTSAFEKFLCAVYNHPYAIVDANEFLELVELADYYCALPTLSRTFDGAMMRSPQFVTDIRYKSLDLLVAATKIRNALLFREALVWIVGPHNHPEYRNLNDRRLRSLARCAHGEISTRISTVMQHLLTRAHDMTTFRFAHNFDAAALDPHAIDNIIYGDAMTFPSYFRNLVVGFPELSNLKSIHQLLENRLKLSGSHLVAGEANEGLADYFLCASVADEDLPWDPEELDF
ncbi:hypothetical protein BKA65DRAFT_409686 [Rhexocercosporidium sp. MPI-PUGE-AT-0058]|nr:hypothetical protein BKA65DRAFT_409686 [Rhexocercosporidium sp. MPI-PUGE-AT-0058]